MTVPAAVLTEIRTLRRESVPSWPAVSLAERQDALAGRSLRLRELVGHTAGGDLHRAGTGPEVNAFADITVTTIRSPEKEGEAISLGAAPAVAGRARAPAVATRQREGPIHGATLQARRGGGNAAATFGEAAAVRDFRKR